MTRKLTPDQLDEIEAAAKKATPGEWVHDEFGEVRGSNGESLFLDGVAGCALPISRAIAEHIAMMDPATTLALIAEVRELRSRLLDVRSVVDVVDASASGAVEYCHPYTHEWRAVVPDLFRALREEA